MLALFSPPVLLFDKCAFVCTLIQYISRFVTCQANFSCKLRAREKKKAFSGSNLFDNGWKLSFWCGDSHDWDEAQRNRSSLARWLGLSDDVATATTEMERQRNRSCGSRSYAWIFPFMWWQPYFHAASAESKFSGSPAKSFLPTSPASLPLSDFYLNHRSALPFLYTTFFTPAAPLLWGCPFPPCT